MMADGHRLIAGSRQLRWLAFGMLVLLLPASVQAQQRVRVKDARVTVWKPGFAVVATVANAGDVFDVIRKTGEWFEVSLPVPTLQRPASGFIAASRVEVIDGLPTAREPGQGSTRAEPRTPGAPRQTPRVRPAQPAGRGGGAGPASRPGTANAWLPFVEMAYGRFAAADSFEAVTGSAGGIWLGGGARYEVGRRFYLEAAANRFHASGERVFVFGDQVFKLGIKDDITIVPLVATGGVRLPGRRLVPYLGAGAGAYFLRETSEFADDADKVKDTSLALRAVAGVQWALAPRYSAGIEVQYTSVPDALTSAVSTAFGESNLGGLQIRGKLLFGR
jgi:opacity protein-like surface antigen